MEAAGARSLGRRHEMDGRESALATAALGVWNEGREERGNDGGGGERGAMEERGEGGWG